MATTPTSVAVDRGAADFFAGNHMNPYLWSKEGDLFRAWIVGYNAAKAINNTTPNARIEQELEVARVPLDDSAAWAAVPKVNTDHRNPKVNTNRRCTCLGMPGTNDCKVHS